MCEGFDIRDVRIRLARSDERRRWDETMNQRHYLGFNGFVGRGLRYIAEHQGEWLALAGWQGGVFKCQPRDRWIGWKKAQQFRRLHLIANNTRFLLLPDAGEAPNLGSFVMAGMLRRLSEDWKQAWGHPLELAEAFVEPLRFKGTVYRAGNWHAVGRSKGYARSNGRYTDPHGKPKEMFVYPLRPDASSRLKAIADDPEWVPESQAVDATHVDLVSLAEMLSEVDDFRRPQGRKHRLEVVLSICILARLAGKVGADATSRYAEEMPQSHLRSLGAWRHPKTRRYVAPSRATIHRVMTETDPEALQKVSHRWVAAQAPRKKARRQGPEALAADGKRINGANRNGKEHFETVTLVRHQDAVPVATRICREENGETAAVAALLEDVDLRGSTITMDALHTSRATADSIVLTHGANYLFTVKGNTPELHDFLRNIDWDKDAQDRYAETPDKGHGRIDQRSIQTCTLVKGAVKMPHAAQVFRIRRCREHVSSNDPGSTEFAYGVTSLTRKEAGAKQLLALNRGHWTVENGNHRRRDGILGEDSCRMRTRHGPANNALFNNMALAIIFQAGYTNLAAATDAYQSKRNKGFRTITKPSSLRCPGKS